MNRPVILTDPSGHKCVGEPEECLKDNGKPINGAGEKRKPKPKDDMGILEMPLWECGKSASNVAACADVVAASVATANAIFTNLAMATEFSAACSVGGIGCIPGLGIAAATNIAATNGPVGQVENGLGLLSFLATAYSDFNENGTTNFTFDDTRGMTINIGQDTIISGRNALGGFIPEVNTDMAISLSQASYDNGRMTGNIPARVGYSISIPTSKSITNNVPKMIRSMTKCGSIICLQP
jgi:hypothetical protein